MCWTRTSLALAAWVLGIVSAMTATIAAPVKPGQTVVVDASDFETPEGTILASTTIPFSIGYTTHLGGGAFVDFPGTTDGTLTSAVMRDDRRGTLAFLYGADLDGDYARAGSILTVDGFNLFSTEVDAAFDFENKTIASRSVDGSSIKVGSDDPGKGGPPQLVVRTDATEFASTGTARFFAGDFLAVRTDDGLAVEFVGGTAIVAGMFQPVADNDVEPAPAPNPIPLPPAVWTALGSMLVVGASRAWKRAQRLRTTRTFSAPFGRNVIVG